MNVARMLVLFFASLFFVGGALADGHPSSTPPLVLGLDHIPVVVRDLEKAEADFRAMGFTIKPGRAHEDGIRNAHVKFADGTEIELITAAEAVDELTSEYRAKMKSGEGPVYFGLFSADPAAMRARIGSLHIDFQAENGLITFPGASPLHPLFFGQQNKSRSDVPAYFAHKNSAARLSALWVRDVPELRRALEGLGVPLVSGDPCGVMGAARTLRAALPEGDIYLVPSDSANVLAARVEVRRLGDVEAILRASGIRATQDPAGEGGWWVSPGEAHGIWLEFVGPQRSPPPARGG